MRRKPAEALAGSMVVLPPAPHEPRADRKSRFSIVTQEEQARTDASRLDVKTAAAPKVDAGSILNVRALTFELKQLQIGPDPPQTGRALWDGYVSHLGP